MTLEKPISTIRKAIQVSAEQAALNDSLDKPEERHYNIAFNVFKMIKLLSPTMIERVILLLAKGKDIKEEMGVESYKVFDKVWQELTKGFKNKTNEIVSQLKEMKQLSSKELNKEILNYCNLFLKEKGEQLKNDPRIVLVFKGREALLNKSVVHAISATLDFLESYEKNAPKWTNLS